MERLRRFFGYTRVNKGPQQQRQQRQQRQQQQSHIRNFLPRAKGLKFNNITNKNKNRSVRPTKDEIKARKGVSKTTHATGLNHNVSLTEENARVFADIMHATNDMPNNNDKMMNKTIQHISETVNEPRRTTLINHFKYLFAKPNATRKTGVSSD